MKDKKVKFKYVGRGGEFLHGIPARDLTEEDWAGLTKEQREMVEVSLLYKKAEAKAEAKKDNKEE
jgi:hypothetical protein